MKGGLLAGSVFRRVWSKARAAVLDEREYGLAAGKRVCDLRYTCWTTWRNNAVPSAQVVAWGGQLVSLSCSLPMPDV